MRWLAVFLMLLAMPAWADAYQDGSNVIIPDFRTNLHASPGISIKDYRAKADLKSSANCSIAAASTTLTCTTNTFASEDVGKRVVIDYAGAGDTSLQTTIAAYTSPTSVTLADAASTATPYFGSSLLVRNAALLTTDNNVGAVTGYVPGDTVTLAGGTGTTATVVAIYATQVWSAAIVNGGTGGTIGGGTTTGECSVRGTTGGTAEGTARAVIRVNLVAGVVGSVSRWTTRGFYKVNPTNPASEPVVANSSTETPDDGDDSFSSNVPPCTGLTGAIFTFHMGPMLSTRQVRGVYSVAPTNNVAQASTSGSGAGATFLMQFPRAGSMVFYTDDYAAFSDAIAAANVETLAGRRACVHIPAGQYGIRGTGTALPRLSGPGCVKGESAEASLMFIDPGYSGDVFSETDSWFVAFTIDGTLESYNTQKQGSSYTDFSIVGDRLSPNTQNAIIFYDRTDYAHIDNVIVRNLPGTCLSFGRALNVGQAGARESHVGSITCWRTGKDGATHPVVEYRTTGTFGSGPHQIEAVNIIGSFGTSMVIRGGVRNFSVGLARIEGLYNSIAANDLVQIGDPADTLNTFGVAFGILNLVNIPPGQAGISVNPNATASVPFGITFERINITGGANYGKGINLKAGRLMAFGINQIAVRDRSIEVAASPLTGAPIEIRGSGGEPVFDYGGAGLSNLSMPLRMSGVPGSFKPIGATIPYSVPGCQSGVPVTVRSEAAVLAASCLLPPLRSNDSIVVETLWSWPSSANAKTPVVRLHTSAAPAGGTQYMGFNATTTLNARCVTRIANAGSAASQVASGSACNDSIGSASAVITSAINTSSTPTYVNITAHGDAVGVAASEDITLLSWSVKIQPGS